MGKDKLSNCSIETLLAYEKSANVICRYYENAVKTYDGAINTTSSEYYKLQKINDIRLKIIKAIETKITDLENDFL